MSKKTNSIYEKADLASRYFLCRPTYPENIFDHLAAIAPRHELAVDCGTGNGQAAQSLARRFKDVVAIDTAEQIARAPRCQNVRYVSGEAETIPLADRTADLITAAQAIHWFDLGKFYSEVERVLRSGGILAAWCYLVPTVEVEIDVVFKSLYRDDRLHRFWPSWIDHVENGYSTLPAPRHKQWEPFDATATAIHDLGLFLEVIDTWAVVQLARKTNDQAAEECLAEHKEMISRIWGTPSTKKLVSWRISGVLARLD